MFKTYYDLTKPGLVYGNLLVAAAAFVYAVRHTALTVPWITGVWMLVGLGCVIGSACVFNNFHDRDMDAKMERTKHRALANKHISNRNALFFGTVLLIVGVLILIWFTNVLTFLVALVGFLVYVFLYTPLKPRSPYALFVGAVAGATPPMVGYVSVTNILDSTTWILFIFLFFWQLPHFLAIAVYRNDEYRSAGVPLFMKGPYTASQKMLGRTIFFSSLIVLLVWCAVLCVV